MLGEEKLRNLLQYIEDMNIEIACICETWFDAQTGRHTTIIKQEGFQIVHANREEKRGGGVAIIYKEQSRVKKGEASSEKYPSFEFVYCTIRTAMSKILLVSIYRRQEVACTVFCTEFETFMESIYHKGDQVIVTGDFNVWIEEVNTDSTKLMTMMNAFGLTQCVTEATHVEGHTLDQVYVNECQMNVKCKVGEKNGISTDHFPVMFELPKIEVKENVEIITFRNKRDMDLEGLRGELKEALENISYEESFEQCYKSYESVTKEITDRYVPVIRKKIKVRSEIPWMDEEYRSERRKRRQLEKKWRSKKNEESRLKYVEQRQLCAELSMKKQNEHYTKIVEKAGNDQKTLFNVANTLLDRREARTLPEHTDALELANEFNEYYIDKINKLRNTIPETEKPATVVDEIFCGQELSVFEPATEEEIVEIVKTFGVKTSPEDPIPADVMESVLDVAIPSLTALVNKSLSEGSIEGVKTSVIDPLLKNVKLDSDVKKNFRPVNNLVFFSKLTERVVKRRLNRHMRRNALHSHKQFAYKQFHSTETMMLGVSDEVLMGFENNQCTIMVFLDLSAAFDTIDIDRLLEILRVEIGITGVALEWFKSFLKGRTQRVRIDGKLSSIMEILFGTVQGSVLGPDLFSIYVRYQPQVFQQCSFKSTSFADDSNGRKTFAIEFQFNICKNDVANLLMEITKWMNWKFMKINPEKTEILLFYPKALSDKVIVQGIIVGNQCIRFSKVVKNVGIWLDEQLNLDSHINKVVSHSHKLLKDIGKIRNVISVKHTEMLVHAVISSRLDYGNSMFFNMSKSNTYKLQKVQNAAARLVKRKRKREGISSVLRELHWLKVESRVIFKIVLLVYKCINGMCSENLNRKLKYKKFNCRPEDYLLLETNKVSTKYGRRTFAYAGPRLWNALPLKTRTEEDIESFKRQVKTLLFKDTDGFKRRAFRYE